jgi:hypothetical protein
VCADEIYKWTDEEGNVHYEDRPSGAPSEQRLQFSYNRTNSSDVQKRVQGQRDATAARQDARSEAEAAKSSAEENRAAADAKAAKCTEYRAKMKTMLESRRLYREDESGERVYLDDAAREEARQKAEELIKENCGNN